MTGKEKTELNRILTEHAARYPLMEPCDAVKLVFQNEFGGDHLIRDREQVFERLCKEFGETEYCVGNPMVEEIGNGLVRVMLNGLRPEGYPLRELCEDFVRSAQRHHGNRESFLEKLHELKGLAACGTFGFLEEELESYLKEYINSGCPPVSHSAVYRGAYHPAYRVVLQRELSCSMTERAAASVVRKVTKLKEGKSPVIVAVDGRCASGKTTLAARLGALLGCPVVHMDDFFLRPEQRTAERYAQPGGNVDRERFLEEVLLPLYRGEGVVYRPFNCATQKLTEAVELPHSPVVVVEGSYSCHPELAGYYDLKVFLAVDPQVQMKRITVREGEAYARVFREKWIPLEEKYFTAFEVEKYCEMFFDMTDEKR